MDNNNSELPDNLIPEETGRQNLITDLLKSSLLDKQEIADGYAYTFPGGNDFLMVLVAFIRLERVRFPFLKFELTVRDEKTQVILKITGPDGVKDLLKNELPF